MKIVRIIARLNVGGPARHVVWLTEALQTDEFQSVLLTGTVPAGEADMNWFAAERAVKPFYIPEMSRELSAKDAVSLWKVFRRFIREKPDIVHTHTAKAGTIGRAAGFLYKWLTPKTLIGKPRPVKFVHTFHGHVFHSYYRQHKTLFFLLIEKFLARLATDKIIVISDQQFEEIHRRFGVGRASQFKIIPLGIDLEQFAESETKRNVFRRELAIKPGEILVGIVGRLTEIKNLSLFLKVAELYKNTLSDSSPKLRFIIIGDGNLRQSLEKEAAELDVKDIVEFLGNRSDTDIFYAGLDIVALTSHNEGTPLSLIEAMANARPVISTAVGGTVDLLGTEVEKVGEFVICERGVKINPNDAKGFLHGLIYLSKHKILRDRLGAAGKEFVVSNYSKERLVGEIADLYRDLSAKKR